MVVSSAYKKKKRIISKLIKTNWFVAKIQIQDNNLNQIKPLSEQMLTPL